jgi:hypothetical protein
MDTGGDVSVKVRVTSQKQRNGAAKARHVPGVGDEEEALNHRDGCASSTRWFACPFCSASLQAFGAVSQTQEVKKRGKF